MQWLLFALLGAFFDSTYYMLIKKNIKNMNPYFLSSGVFLVASFVLLLTSYLNGFPEIGKDFYIAAIISIVLNIIAVYLYLKALETTDLSLAIPMISFTPVFLIITSTLILGEKPTILGIAGIILISVGAYVLNSKKSQDILEPIKSMFQNKGVIYMLIVSFLFSITSNYDKLVLLNSDVFFSSGVVLLFLGSGLFILGLSNSKKDVKEIVINLKKLVFIGIVFSLIAITINKALEMQIVPYVISIKRLSILFSVLYGHFVFKEENIVMRFLGAFIMLLGSVLIVIG